MSPPRKKARRSRHTGSPATLAIGQVPQIAGFLASPKKDATAEIYRGRYTCTDVQWTGTGADSFVTFTTTADELAAAAESRLLWTDQDVQRGIVPGSPIAAARELAIADGYPDSRIYIFKADNADDMVEKLHARARLFLDPLVWNLRPGTFEAYWDGAARRIYIYSGRIFLPDSHHRHQAILKAVRTWREAPQDYPSFSGARQFKVELYFLSREDEGNYFFDKNQRPTRTEKSKAYDLTTGDDLSLLAKRTIALSTALQGNVNRVTDRLTLTNPQVITLSTLREMMRLFASEDHLDATQLEGLATIAAQFYDLLARIRPELGLLDMAARKGVRQTLVVDSATVMHGYAAIMRDFADAIAREGARKAEQSWLDKLSRLSSTTVYTFDQWSGDLFEKANPLWQAIGVTKPGRTGKGLTVLNTGAARSESGRALRQLLSTEPPSKDLAFLATR
jgi:hypothetical protein